MNGICKIILIGNLGAEPESRDLPSGFKITNARVCTTESFKSSAPEAQNGYLNKDTWHSLVFRDKGNYKLGQYASELEKGQKIYVEGTLINRTFEKDGVRHYRTEIDVEVFERLPRGAKSFQEVTFIGTSTNAPETQYLPSGAAKTTLNGAINRNRPKAGEQGYESVGIFTRFLFIDRGSYKLGDKARNISIGSTFLAKGKVKVDEWESDGVKKSSTYVAVDSFQDFGSQQQAPQQQAPQQQAPQQQAPIPNFNEPNNGFQRPNVPAGAKPQSFGTWGNGANG